MTEKEELQKVLENHKHWLCEDVDGWEHMKANLSSANLYGANLSSADLRCANLSGANLSGADLRCANLYGANLSSANLYGANLSGADLRGADLRCANLYGANLSSANLYGANLHCADLRGADLSDADLHCANLRGADLSDAEHLPYIPTVCPEEGEFIGWKRAGLMADKIVKLLITDDAKRSSATTRKCRCSKAIVLEIYNLDGTVSEKRKCCSNYNINFIYKVGETVEVPDFDNNRWNECSTGIHFFINRREALDYKM